MFVFYDVGEWGGMGVMFVFKGMVNVRVGIYVEDVDWFIEKFRDIFYYWK